MKVKPMTPDERQALIRRPFPSVKTYGGKGWGGTTTNVQDFRLLHSGGHGRDDDPNLAAYEPYSDWSRE